MDSHKNHKAFVLMVKLLERMSAVVRLVHVWFPLEAYVKDFREAQKQTVAEL